MDETTAASGTIGTELRVRYAETDAMGVVYYANYLAWFELGRTGWIRAHGFTYREVEEQGLLLPVTHASCDYRQSARYDDLVRVETTIARLSRASVAFTYRVVRSEPAPDALLAAGRTEHVFLTREGRIARLDRQSPFWLALSAGVVRAGGA